MRIRRNPLRKLGLPFPTTTQLVQPEAPPSETLVLAPTAVSHIAVPAAVLPPAAPSELCSQNYAWIPHPHALNFEELNHDAYGLIGDSWREPRENPGFSYVNADFVPRQQEVEIEVEVEEDIYLVKKKKEVEDQIEKQKPQNQVNENPKQDVNEQNKGSNIKPMMEAKVTENASIKPLKCKKNDGRKWKCANDAVVFYTLCEKHLHQSRSYYINSLKEARKASASSKSAQPKVSSNTKAEVASDVPVASSKAAATGAGPSSKRPRKEVVDDYSGGAFYCPEPFGPFRGKQRGHYSSNKRVKATHATVEEERSIQVDGGAQAPEEGGFHETSLSKKVARKRALIEYINSMP